MVSDVRRWALYSSTPPPATKDNVEKLAPRRTIDNPLTNDTESKPKNHATKMNDGRSGLTGILAHRVN